MTVTVACSILQTPTRERVVGFRAVLVVGENGRIEAVLNQSTRPMKALSNAR